MSKRSKLYIEIMNDGVNNISFNKVQTFLIHSNFVLKNHVGSHEIYEHLVYTEYHINIQDKNGDIKGYQLKQIRIAIKEIEQLEKMED